MSAVVKISSTNVTGTPSSLTVTGITSTYDVYAIVGHNFQTDTTGGINMQFTSSGSPITNANYDRCAIRLSADTTYVTEDIGQNGTGYSIVNDLIDDTTQSASVANFVLYLYNFPISEYSYLTQEASYYSGTSGVDTVQGRQGGVVLKETTICDGVYIFPFTGGALLTNGTIDLYAFKQ